MTKVVSIKKKPSLLILEMETKEPLKETSVENVSAVGLNVTQTRPTTAPKKYVLCFNTF